MSTTSTTAASRTAPPPSASVASSKFGTFVTTFSITGPVVYCLTQYFNYPLFTFHPATNRIVWGYEAARSGEGPNMLWYGWSATTILIAAVLGIIAMMLPERIIRKIPLSLVWILPILSVPYIVYSLMPWWTLALGHGK
jgi:hypothetical protein